MEARLGSTHTAETCASTGRPVSASTTAASAELMMMLMTDVLNCSVGLKTTSDLKHTSHIKETESDRQCSKVSIMLTALEAVYTLKFVITEVYSL